MRRFTLLLWITLLLSSIGSIAAKVTPGDARKVATPFLNERFAALYPGRSGSFEIKSIDLKEEQDVPLYYIIRYSPEGWVILSADDRTVPVLAYSFEGDYSEEASPEACRAWMKQYEDQVRDIIISDGTPFSYVPGIWKNALDGTPPGRSILAGMAPLILSNWDQAVPYNAQCPADASGPGGHALTGCVPTCMGQLVNYFRWPTSGTGSYSYTDPKYGTLSANFDTVYDWSNMTSVPTVENPAIALLLSHLGISCDLVYGPDASGMYNHKAAYSLGTYFKYLPQTQYLFRDSTTLAWDSTLIANLDKRIPVYYAGWSVPNIAGHAFVCDGYQDSCYFHFNFGWSGQSNGYFYTSDLTPSGYNFNLAQEVIINAFPDTVNYTYPDYSPGNHVLKYAEGSIDDGSGPMYPYLPNTSNSWLIDPQTDLDSVSSITLSFGRFELNAGDYVTVYDGGTTSDPVLGSFTGNSLPSDVASTGPKMLITFQSAGGSSGPGFLANYKTTVPVWCSGMTIITADTAEISDGSYRFNYHNNQNCKWKLMTASGGPMTLNFRSFDTEAGNDVLKIYDLATTTLVAELSGSYDSTAPPAPVTVESGQAMLIFTTNSAVTGKGWEIYYPKSNLGISDNEGRMAFRVFPNPAKDEVNLSFRVADPEIITVTVSDLRGIPVFSFSGHSSAGLNQFTLPTAKFAAGIYTIELKTQSSTLHKKLIIK